MALLTSTPMSRPAPRRTRAYRHVKAVNGTASTHGRQFPKIRSEPPRWRVHGAQNMLGTAEARVGADAQTSGCPILRPLKPIPEFKIHPWVAMFRLYFTDIFAYQRDQVQGCPVVKGYTGEPTYMVGASQLVREVLSNDMLFDGSSLVHGKLVGSDGVQFMQGDRHAQMRSKLNHAFTTEELEKYTPQVQDLAIKYLDNMVRSSNAPGARSTPALSHFKDFTFEIICDVVAGLQLNPAELKEMQSSYIELVKGIIYEALDIPILKSDLPFMPGRKYRAACAAIRQRLQQSLDAARQALQEGVDSSSSIITELASLTDSEGQPLPDKTILDNLVLFLFAGYDTSSHLLTIMCQYIDQHPQHWQTVLDEQAALVAQHGERISPRVLRVMPATERFVRESLRMRSPVPHLSRTVAEDTVLGDYPLPKGALVYLPLQYISRTESAWEGEKGDLDPAKFNPDRFKSASGLMNQLAFGAGRHICLGMSLAMMEMKVLLAVLARGYKVRVVESSHWMNIPMVHPTNGLPVVVTNR